MRSQIWTSVLCAFLLVAFAHAPLCARNKVGKTSKLTRAEIEKWREDLRYLAQNMPKRHKNLFHTMSREQFETAVNSLDRRLASLSRHEVIVNLARIVAMVSDGHTGIQGFFYGPKVGFRYYPIALYLFNDGLFIYAADPKYASAVGARVLRIGNASADEAISVVSDLVFRDNEIAVKERVPLLLTTPEVLHAVGLIEDMEEAQFVVEYQGRRQTLELRPAAGQRASRDNWALGQRFSKLPNWVDARDGSLPPPLWLKDPENYFWFEYLANSQTVYVQYNEVANKDEETVAEFAKRLFAFVEAHEVRRFVLDLRWNTGGNNYLNKPLLLGILKSQKIDQRGKLFAIIGRRTFSAAQNLVNDLEKFTNVLFVGEPTAGNPNFFGDATSVVLPNSGITVRVSTLWWQDLDPRDPRRWTGPRVAVELSSDDYRKNHDPAMNSILNFIPRKELGETMMESFLAGNSAEAVRVYREFKQDPTNKYVNTQVWINNLGYSLIGMKRFVDAIEAFKLNVEAYPNSANAHDSLGEAYLKSGNKALAIKSYKRSLELDPANANAVEVLNQISQK